MTTESVGPLHLGSASGLPYSNNSAITCNSLGRPTSGWVISLPLKNTLIFTGRPSLRNTFALSILILRSFSAMAGPKRISFKFIRPLSVFFSFFFSSNRNLLKSMIRATGGTLWSETSTKSCPASRALRRASSRSNSTFRPGPTRRTILALIDWFIL